ncbi:hypothetical protein EMPG_11531, partial [Blastomyces silverae]
DIISCLFLQFLQFQPRNKIRSLSSFSSFALLRKWIVDHLSLHSRMRRMLRR